MEPITIWFIIILCSIYAIFHGAVYGRIDGGGVAKVAEWTERSLVMFYFVLACSVVAGPYATLAFIGVVGIATGHGQYFLARVAKCLVKTKERVDPFVRLFFGRDPRDNKDFLSLKEGDPKIVKAMQEYGMTKLYWRCAFGMFTTGTLLGIPAYALFAYFGFPIIGIPFLFTGVVKALAYVICYELFGNTETAEYANGGARTALCVVALVLSIFAVLG